LLSVCPQSEIIDTYFRGFFLRYTVIDPSRSETQNNPICITCKPAALYLPQQALISIFRSVSHSAEEILHANNAIWMSDNGQLMLYATFNDTHVQEQHFAWYGTTGPSGGPAAAAAGGGGGAGGAGSGGAGASSSGSNPHANLYPEIRSLR